MRKSTEGALRWFLRRKLGEEMWATDGRIFMAEQNGIPPSKNDVADLQKMRELELAMAADEEEVDNS